MSKSKDKGRRLENMVADALNTNGIQAERIPLSGALGGKYDCDVVIGTPEQPIATVECKNRESISQFIWDSLEGNDFLVIKRNQKQPLVVMTLDKFINLWKGDKHDNDD